MQYFSAYFLNDPRKWFSLQYNMRDEKQQQKRIWFKKCKPKKRCSFINLFTYFDISLLLKCYIKVQYLWCFIPTNLYLVSLNQLKGLLPGSKPKKLTYWYIPQVRKRGYSSGTSVPPPPSPSLPPKLNKIKFPQSCSWVNTFEVMHSLAKTVKIKVGILH